MRCNGRRVTASQQAWELEIELLGAADEQVLVAVAEVFSHRPGLIPMHESKYQRGLALLEAGL